MVAARLLLIVLVLATFAPLYTAEFVRLDDPYTLHHNPRLNPATWAHIASYWREWKTGEEGLYIPVTYTLWSGLAKLARVDYPDFGGIALNPWVFHSANILVHTTSTLLVFGILFKLLARPIPATIGAALFAIHPVQVETVAWASGMKDLLAGMFALAAIRVHLALPKAASEHSEEADRPARDDRRIRPFTALRSGVVIAFAALAMLSKPSAVMLGPICFIIDVLLFKQSTRRALLRVLPMLLIAIPIALIARHVQEVNLFAATVWWLRPIIAGDALTFYLGKLIFPLHLAPDYGQRPQVVLSASITYVLAVVPLLLALLIWRWRNRYVIAASLIFLIALLPVLGFTSFQFQYFSTVTDHYLYLAMLGPALAAGWVASLRPGRTTFAIASVLLALLAIRSFVQSLVWRDDFALFTHTLFVNPQSFLARNNLGTAYEEQAGRAEQAGDSTRANQMRRNAMEQYDRAIAANPDFAPGYAHLAAMSRHFGDRERAAWAMLQMLRITLSLPERARGDYLSIILGLSDDLIAAGRYDQAVQFLSQYVCARPDDTAAAMKLAEARAHARTTTTRSAP
jgi:tetratricopeptide (TPR) repeat protein